LNLLNKRNATRLAAAIGTSHGAYKFKGQQSLHFDVIEGIRDKDESKLASPTPNRHARLVERSENREVDRINAAGGKLDRLLAA